MSMRYRQCRLIFVFVSSSSGPSHSRSGQIAFRSNTSPAISKNHPATISVPHGRKVSDGVHVQVRFLDVGISMEVALTKLHSYQMDTFAVSEVDESTQKRAYDLEDPEMGGDYKRPPY